MKTTLPRQAFQEALAAISSVTSGRTTKPILACVLLRAAEGRVELSATDGEVGLRAGVSALTVKRAGETVLPAGRLLDIVRELTAPEVYLEADERHCTIRVQGSEFKLLVSNPADFPPIPGFEDEPDLSVDGHTLRNTIALTLYAAARETSRYAINGVLWQKQGKRLYLIATDGRRLARAGTTLHSATSADFQAILPSRALNVFERVFTGGADEWLVDVKVLPNQVLLRSGDRVLSTTIIEGLFPPYDQVIPQDNNKRVRLSRTEFYSGIRRAALLTTDDSRAVRLSFDKNQLVITSQSPEQGEARVEVPADYDGERVEIGFNPAFLGDALKALTVETVFFEMKEGFRPGVLCGEDKADFLYVIMPVSLT